MSAAPEKKQKVLFLVHRIPYPPDKGDKIRSWRLLNFLRQYFDVALGYFVDDPADHKHTAYLQELCAQVKAVSLSPRLARLKSMRGLLSGEALTFPYYRSGEMAAWVAEQRAGGVAAEIVFSSSMAQYLDGVTAPTFVDMVDADSAKWSQYAETKPFPMSWVYRREGAVLAKAEAAITRTATATFLITPPEADIIRAYEGANAQAIDWYMNGVDTEYFDPAAEFAPAPKAPDLIFSGAMDYWANADAVIWFADKVWPQLLARKPDITLAIVGARPTKGVQKLAELTGIEVTGRVEDMRSWLAAAKVSIAPLRIARGVQNKVLEAMAMGKPVVASPGAYAGIVAEEGQHLFVREEPAEITATILSLLENAEQRVEMGEKARAHVVSTYGWEAQLERFADRLRQAGLHIG
jgi:sugar transferase (PEP-CTERM/EpsH1 system associated)